ncbi:MAG: DinB family protein [Chloroflexota bacterium]|nr:DinB family protein [Chloroflexota bacterium]
MVDRQTLLRELDDARALLLSALEGMIDADLGCRLPAHSWTVADLLHHITAWDEVGATTVEAMENGTRVNTYVDDVDAWNDQAVAARRGNLPETTLGDLHAARERLRSALITASPSLWEKTCTTPKGHPVSLPEICRTWTRHDAEHAADLRAVRDRDPAAGPQTS